MEPTQRKKARTVLPMKGRRRRTITTTTTTVNTLLPRATMLLLTIFVVLVVSLEVAEGRQSNKQQSRPQQQ